MKDDLIFAGFGAALAAIGIVLIVLQVKARRTQLLDTEQTEREQRFLTRQHSHRMQTSAFTVVMGALIAVGGRVMALGKSPWIATTYVCVLLVLAVWLMLLGVGDAVATRIHAQSKGRSHKRKHTNLADALAEVRSAYGLPEADSPASSDLPPHRRQHDIS